MGAGERRMGLLKKKRVENSTNFSRFLHITGICIRAPTLGAGILINPKES